MRGPSACAGDRPPTSALFLPRLALIGSPALRAGLSAQDLQRVLVFLGVDLAPGETLPQDMLRRVSLRLRAVPTSLVRQEAYHQPDHGADDGHREDQLEDHKPSAHHRAAGEGDEHHQEKQRPFRDSQQNLGAIAHGWLPPSARIHGRSSPRLVDGPQTARPTAKA